MVVSAIARFNRELRLLGIAASLYVGVQMLLVGIALMRPVESVAPGQIERNVTKLGGPCMAVKAWAYDRYGPLGIGECSVRYTNAAKTVATVELQIFRSALRASVTADTATSGGPLASLNWRVTGGGEETPWYGAGIT